MRDRGQDVGADPALVGRRRYLLVAWAFLTIGLAIRCFAQALVGREEVPVSVAPYRVDVNRASVVDLELLPGLGRARAEGIVLERIRHGPFRRIEDLQRVDGIGPALVRAIEPFAECAPLAPPNPR